MLFGGDFSFANFLTDVLVIFLFIVWLWLFILVVSDLFRRHDISGLSKALWIIFLLVLPYIGVLAYLISQSGSMAERNNQQAQQAHDELRRVVGFSVADEIKKLDQLKKSGEITEEEFTRLRARLVH